MRVLIEPTIVFPAEAEQAINKIKSDFKAAEIAATKAGQAGADGMAKAAAPIKAQVGLISGLKKELGALGHARDEAFDPAEVKRLNQEIGVTQKKLTELESLGKSQNPITSFFGGAADFIKGGLIVGAIDKIGGAISNGASEMVDLILEFEKFQKVVSQSTGLTEAELSKQTASLTAVSKTFGKDQKELLIATNSVAQQFGISQEDAIDLISKGFTKGADANDEFLKILKEYPAQFKAAGLSAEQFIAATTEGAQLGIYDDKAIDTIKEFGLRIREMTSTTRDALINAFGQPFTDELSKSVKAGEITSAQALQRVSAEINKVNPNAQQTAQLLADVFAAPGEDAGIDYIKSLESLGQGLDSVRGASAEMEAGLLATLETQKRIAEATAELSLVTEGAFTNISNFGNQLKAFALEGLVGIITFLKDLAATLIALPSVIAENKVAFGLLLTALVSLNAQLIVTSAQMLIQQARIKGQIILQKGWALATGAVTLAQRGLNIAMRANPIGLVIALIAALVGTLILVYDKFWQVRAATDGFIAGLKTVGDTIGGYVMDTFRGLAEAIGGIIDVLSGDFASGFARIGKGIAMATTGAVQNAVKGFGQVGADSAKAFNDRYERELKEGAPSATVNETPGAAPEPAAQRPFNMINNTVAKKAATVASQKYEEQLRFETDAIKANIDALADSTIELDKQRRDVLRTEGYREQGFNPLQIDLLELRNDTEELRRASEIRRNDATSDVKEASREQLTLLKKQRDERQKELDKAVLVGGNRADIENLKKLLLTYDAEVVSIEKQTALARTEVITAFNRNIQAIEHNSYAKRTAMLNAYIAANRAAIVAGDNEMRNLSASVQAEILARDADFNAQKYSVDLTFQPEIQLLKQTTAAAETEIASLRERLSDPSADPLNIAALETELALQIQILNKANLEEQALDLKYRENTAKVEAKFTQMSIQEMQKKNDAFVRTVENSLGQLNGIDLLGDLPEQYSKALTQLGTIRRKFAGSEQDQLLKQLELNLDIEMQEAQFRLEEIQRIEREQGIKLTEAKFAVNRQIVSVEDRRLVLAEERAQTEEDFEKDKFNKILDASIAAYDAIASTVSAITDLQIREIDRLISAQQGAVSEAEKIAETGNSRQLALERERLDTLQKEREKFVRRQQALAVLELIANSAVAVAKAAAQGGVAAPITIAATLVALGIGLAQARAQAQSASAGFKVGGYTGDAANDHVAGVVHGREFVINAAATERYRPLLESMNKGEPLSKPVAPKMPAWGTQEVLKQIRAGALDYAPAVHNWARTDSQVVQNNMKMDGLEREIRGLREDIGQVVDAVDRKPVADFRYDEKGVRKRMKSFDRIESKTRRRAS